MTATAAVATIIGPDSTKGGKRQSNYVRCRLLKYSSPRSFDPFLFSPSPLPTFYELVYSFPFPSLSSTSLSLRVASS